MRAILKTTYMAMLSSRHARCMSSSLLSKIYYDFMAPDSTSKYMYIPPLVGKVIVAWINRGTQIKP